jgi:hypothetical protein
VVSPTVLVLINNNTMQYVTIWVDGSYRTEIAPGAAGSVTVNRSGYPTLTANGDNDSDTWQRTMATLGTSNTYTWNIN